MALIKNNDELDSTILIIGALVVWIAQMACVALLPEYAKTPVAAQASRFIDGIVLMVFTFKFTKSTPRNGGNGEK